MNEHIEGSQYIYNAIDTLQSLNQQIQQAQVDKQMLRDKTCAKIKYKGCNILVRQNDIIGTIYTNSYLRSHFRRTCGCNRKPN